VYGSITIAGVTYTASNIIKQDALTYRIMFDDWCISVENDLNTGEM